MSFLFASPVRARAGEPGAFSFGSDADFAVELAANFNRLRMIARKTIRQAGLDPVQCRDITRERESADAVFWAAHMLMELDRIQQYLERAGRPEIEDALGSVMTSLAFVGLYHSLTTGSEESAAAQPSVRKEKKNGQAKAENYVFVACQMAEEFRRRQHARDLKAGAMMGAPRPSDAELKRQIGAEYGIGKSAAVDAINHGLTILGEAAGTLN